MSHINTFLRLHEAVLDLHTWKLILKHSISAVQLLLHLDVLRHGLPNSSSPEEVCRKFYAKFEVALLIDSAPHGWFRKVLECL